MDDVERLIEFARNELGMELLPYQERFLRAAFEERDIREMTLPGVEYCAACLRPYTPWHTCGTRAGKPRGE